ncbi:hypothetical protein CEXT_209771, partial [Caerostris extrusa]
IDSLLTYMLFSDSWLMDKASILHYYGGFVADSTLARLRV